MKTELESNPKKSKSTLKKVVKQQLVALGVVESVSTISYFTLPNLSLRISQA